MLFKLAKIDRKDLESLFHKALVLESSGILRVCHKMGFVYGVVLSDDKIKIEYHASGKVLNSLYIDYPKSNDFLNTLKGCKS
jgi:hypothetical protein